MMRMDLYDAYVDVSNGATGASADLRLLRSDELPRTGDEDAEVRAMRARLAGIDKGVGAGPRGVMAQQALRLARQMLAGRTCRCFLDDAPPWEGHNASCPEGQLDAALEQLGY